MEEHRKKKDNTSSGEEWLPLKRRAKRRRSAVPPETVTSSSEVSSEEFRTPSKHPPSSPEGSGEESNALSPDSRFIKRYCPRKRRRQLPCPLPNCRRAVQDVRRHLVQHHGYAKLRAVKVMTRLAERYRLMQPKAQRHQCPDCPSRVVRLDNHRKFNCPARKEKITAEEPGLAATQQPHSKDSHQEAEVPDEKKKSFTEKRHRRSNLLLPTDVKIGCQEFGLWMRSLSAGELSLSSSDQYRQLVQQFFTDLGRMPSFQDLQDIGKPDGLMQQFRNCHSATTVKNLCIALKHFSAFKHAKGQFSLHEEITLKDQSGR